MSTQTLTNPFLEDDRTDAADRDLVAAALAGDRCALESLIGRHQAWIYNIAFRMVSKHQDAEDVTQEILVKILTKLDRYDPERSAFRTWLYRIVANHVINMKTRGYEAAITGFDTFYAFVTEVPDQTPDATPETDLVVEDLTTGCVMATLLCLDRKQRVAFILAIAFGATDAVGSEILGVSKDAFRKTLSRARARLHESMQGNCSVVNPDAPCKCRNKVRSFVDSGAYASGRYEYLAPDRPRIREIVGDTIERFEREIYAEYATLFRGHPVYEPKDAVPWLRGMLEKPEFKEIFRLN